MGILLPYHYVVRPRTALDQLCAGIAPVPWFAERSVWLVMSYGDHDHAGQLGQSEESIRLHFLAALHREAFPGEGYVESLAGLVEWAEKVRSLAVTLVTSWPLTVETFDRFWELLPAGNFVHEASAERARLADLRAVTAPPTSSWDDMIALRTAADERLATALLWSLERLRLRFPAEVPDRRCRVFARHDAAMHTLEVAIACSSWARDGAAPLSIHLDSAHHEEIEFTFDISSAASRPLHEGQVRVTMAEADPGRWRVAEGTLILITRIEEDLDAAMS